MTSSFYRSAPPAAPLGSAWLPVIPPSLVSQCCLLLFLAATPLSVVAVYLLGQDRNLWAIVNMYGFSLAYDAAYLVPLLSGRLHVATGVWVLWMSVFTEVVFQIPHNLCVGLLHAAKGTVAEWPFFAYGLSDARWSQYTHTNGTGLAPAVWLINVNDATLGLAVLAAAVAHWRRPACAKRRLAVVLAVVFRDATLWRETVEYMWDHHRGGYPHTTTDPAHRPHAVACLWLVNIVWLVAPLTSVVWAWGQVRGMTRKAGKEA